MSPFDPTASESWRPDEAAIHRAEFPRTCCGGPRRCYHYHGAFGDENCGDASCDRTKEPIGGVPA